MPLVAATLSATLLFVPCPARALMPDHIRPESCEMATVTVNAMRRSPTFRQMVGRVRTLKGIVYVSPRPYVEGASKRVLNGALLHRVTLAGEHRVLHVLVRPESGDRPAVTLAHELHHAIELLETDADCDADAGAFFARVGTNTGGWTVETPGAAEAERQVRRELRANPR